VPNSHGFTASRSISTGAPPPFGSSRSVAPRSSLRRSTIKSSAPVTRPWNPPLEPEFATVVEPVRQRPFKKRNVDIEVALRPFVLVHPIAPKLVGEPLDPHVRRIAHDVVVTQLVLHHERDGQVAEGLKEASVLILAVGPSHFQSYALLWPVAASGGMEPGLARHQATSSGPGVRDSFTFMHAPALAPAWQPRTFPSFRYDWESAGSRRITNRVDILTGLELVGPPPGHDVGALTRDPQHGEIDPVADRDHSRLSLAAVSKPHGQPVRSANHVAVGQKVSPVDEQRGATCLVRLDSYYRLRCLRKHAGGRTERP